MKIKCSLRRRAATSALASSVAVCIATMGAMLSAHAQPAPPATSPPADLNSSLPSQQASPIDDQTIEKFAAAYQEVSDIQTKAVTALKATNDAKQQAQIRDDAERKSRVAVESKGLAAEEFNRIAQQMLTDETLRSKVLQKVQQQTPAA